MSETQKVPIDRLCKNWDRVKTASGDHFAYGVCNSAHFKQNGRHTTKVEVKSDKGEYITTGENFGCIHFWDNRENGFVVDRLVVIDSYTNFMETL